MSDTYLPQVLPVPVPMDDGFDKPYLDGLTEGRLVIQRCASCGTWIWGPEHVCYHCLAWDPEWLEVEPRGRIYAWTRIHSPGFVALRPATPFICAMVEQPQAGGVRMIGNLLGDRSQKVTIGDEVVGEFERHEIKGHLYGLMHWRRTG